MGHSTSWTQRFLAALAFCIEGVPALAPLGTGLVQGFEHVISAQRAVEIKDTHEALAAFGAHGLKDSLSPDLLSAYETGVLYHIFHSVGLLAIALTHAHTPTQGLRIGGWCMLLGILLFSGSLYTMAIGSVEGIGWITPVGGITWLIGWASALLGVQLPSNGDDS